MNKDDEKQAAPELERQQGEAGLDRVIAAIRDQYADRVFFVHLRVGRGAATLAVRRHAGGGGGRCGVAFCSPADQFSRKRGRLVAAERLFMLEHGASTSGRELRMPHNLAAFQFLSGKDEHLDKAATEAFEAWLPAFIKRPGWTRVDAFGSFYLGLTPVATWRSFFDDPAKQR